ncbi:GTP-binding protein Rhes [Lucilia cuprina]|uniref:GTP-binding protein Rhes n=1 Tax=Lucilia cuprina TaxID=7375 RepID=UPI001F05D0A6|nr:GTP-binding protein Rhes [Lucilia cuprina]XP_046808061.1 GTP-binding protein Rhes [Lucilia cuprina]
MSVWTDVNMIRCKNWFCARSNNNDYAEVLFGDSKTTTQTTAATTDTTTTSNLVRLQQPANGKLSGAATTIANNTTATHAVYNNITAATSNTTSTAGTTASTTSVSNSCSGTAGAGVNTNSVAAGSHVVTFLDDVPSGSNGVVNTTTRLMNNTDLQQQQQQQQQQHYYDHHTSDDLDALDTDDFLANHVVSSAMLCDDTLPTSKNCYRLVILGSSRVGKSSIVARFLGNRFDEAYTPTIEDFHRKLYRIRNEVYQLDILDTSGHHPFPAMRRLSFLTGDIFILVFSMDSRESFEEVVRLRENILETKWAALNPGSGFKKKALPKIPMILAGNKCDKEQRTVQLDEIMGYIAGQDNCCVFVECSAKQNFRIDDLFYALFTASNLPLEMAPNHHRRVVTVFGAPSPLPPHSSTGGSKKNALSIKRRFSDACGVVTPNARRPSIRTDLNLMRSKTMQMNEGDSSVTRKKCVIM